MTDASAELSRENREKWRAGADIVVLEPSSSRPAWAFQRWDDISKNEFNSDGRGWSWSWWQYEMLSEQSFNMKPADWDTVQNGAFSSRQLRSQKMKTTSLEGTQTSWLLHTYARAPDAAYQWLFTSYGCFTLFRAKKWRYRCSTFHDSPPTVVTWMTKAVYLQQHSVSRWFHKSKHLNLFFLVSSSSYRVTQETIETAAILNADCAQSAWCGSNRSSALSMQQNYEICSK